MTTTPAMPELPEPDHRGPAGTGTYFDSYTADQMRAYALATLQAHQSTQGAAPAEDEIVRAVVAQALFFKEGAQTVAQLRSEISAILALRPQSESETFDQWLKRERPAGAVSDMERGWNACAASLPAPQQATPTTSGWVETSAPPQRLDWSDTQQATPEPVGEVEDDEVFLPRRLAATQKLKQLGYRYNVGQGQWLPDTRPAPGVPEADPLQGAVDWFWQAIPNLKAHDVANRLSIGCNRAARLLAAAQAKGGGHG